MVKVVTDSSADLPAQLADELGITVVPLYVRFGEEIYRERVDMTEDDFYQRLMYGNVHPATIQPNPQDFAQVYERVSKETTDGIVSIHLSSKLSGTYNSAVQARKMITGKCPIEVVDSQALTAALGLIVIATAQAAKAGQSLQDVLATAKQAMQSTHFIGLLDTLKYVLLGGRIGRAKALAGSLLNVKPMLTLRDGETTPAGQARSRAKGIERLLQFAKSGKNIEELAIAYSTTPDDAQALSQRIKSEVPKANVRMVRLGTTLGVHTGPGTLVVAFREGNR